MRFRSYAGCTPAGAGRVYDLETIGGITSAAFDHCRNIRSLLGSDGERSELIVDGPEVARFWELLSCWR
jgi:hypothetical protein